MNSLDENLLQGLEHLERFGLYENLFLEDLPEDLLAGITTLRYLFINGNPLLTEIPENLMASQVCSINTLSKQILIEILLILQVTENGMYQLSNDNI